MASRQPFLHDLDVTVAAPTVCLAGADGQIRAGGTQGVLCADVRVLDRAVVTVDGVEPVPVGPSIGVLRELGDPGPDPTVWLRRERSVAPDGIAEVLTVVNASAVGLDIEMAVEVGADLARIEEIKDGGGGPGVAPDVEAGGLRWSTAEVTVRLHAPDAAVEPGSLRWRLDVPARSSVAVGWTLTVRDAAAVVAPAGVRLLRPSAPAGDPRVRRLLDRAFTDLDALLVTEPGHADPFAAAGAPWYLTLFGRDSLWTASLLLPVDVGLAGGTLRTLARTQGTRTDPATAEEPGKIAHERRRAAAWHASSCAMVLPPLYYGTIDATLLWITLLRDAWRHGLPPGEVEALLPHLHAALGWLRDHADRDGDGFAEYFDDSGHGLTNQGWKDSGDAVRDASGRIADGPVALVEVQGYRYEAALAGAELLEAFRAGDPQPWRALAADVASRFREAFWVADATGPYPALALDGAKKPVDALTSNIGHLLGTGLLDDAESAVIGARLVAPDMASGFGLRTMSSAAGGYSPLSYHCGSVWPHDTAIVVRGLLRAGQPERAAQLAGELVTAAEGFAWRLPELFAGFGATEVAAPVAYPASCRPQAWSAAAAVVVAQALLG